MTSNTTIVRAIATNQTTPAIITGYHLTPKENIVLEFESAQVVMPGGWRTNRDLNVGDCVAAYWDADGRFHLEWED